MHLKLYIFISLLCEVVFIVICNHKIKGINLSKFRPSLLNTNDNR